MAKLTLVPRRLPPGVTLAAFHVRGEHASLGRSAHCDWVLPDPQRLLSKRHCEMTRHGDQWFITDFSSNGTTVHGKSLPPGVPQQLQGGESIGCGSYMIEVVLDADDEGDTTQSFPKIDAIRPGEGVSPSVSAALPAGRDVFSGLAGEDMPFGDSPVFDPSNRQRYGRSPVETLSIIHPFSFALSENEGEFDLPASTSAEDPSGLFKGGEAPSGLHDSFRPPRPTSVLLPEDWDSPETLAGQEGGKERGVLEPEPSSELSHNHFSTRAEEQENSAPQKRQGSRPSSRQETTTSSIDQTSSATSMAPPMQESIDTPAWETGLQTSHLPGADAGARDKAALVALMRGAGIEGISGDVPEAFFEDLGRTFRALVVGLRRAMIARARVKSEFRIEQTMIQPFGNNPLKFAVDDDDALSAMLGVGRRTGVSGSEAVADALRDIRIHEMAITKAIEPAMREFLALSSPEAILEQLSLPMDQPLSLLRRAKAWTTYVRKHEELLTSLTETLDGRFGRAFGQAYETAREEIETSEASTVRLGDLEDRR